MTQLTDDLFDDLRRELDLEPSVGFDDKVRERIAATAPRSSWWLPAVAGVVAAGLATVVVVWPASDERESAGRADVVAARPVPAAPDASQLVSAKDPIPARTRRPAGPALQVTGPVARLELEPYGDFVVDVREVRAWAAIVEGREAIPPNPVNFSLDEPVRVTVLANLDPIEVRPITEAFPGTDRPGS